MEICQYTLSPVGDVPQSRVAGLPCSGEIVTAIRAAYKPDMGFTASCTGLGMIMGDACTSYCELGPTFLLYLANASWTFHDPAVLGDRFFLPYLAAFDCIMKSPRGHRLRIRLGVNIELSLASTVDKVRLPP